jgi:DNA-directed RNA polymerase subunit H (RpoH/RPB5)
MASKNTSAIISQIYQSRKHVLELMSKQGFDVSGYAHFSVSEINAMKQNHQLDMLLETTNIDPPRKVYIHYYLAKAIRPANIQEMIDDLFVLTETLKKEHDMLYIILKDNVNDTTMAVLKDIWDRDGIFIVAESIKCLQFNILNHILVPEHIILNDAETKAMLTRYNVANSTQLPEISRFDPVARAIGLRPGQVCKIIRPSKTAITTEYFRICV